MKNPKPYSKIVEILESSSIEEIEKMISDKDETFYLEYKNLSKNDSKIDFCTLAKNISSFGNAEGGVLIYGIENKSKKIVPFEEYKVVCQKITENISRSTSPNHTNVEAFSVKIQDNKGIVYVVIPKSENRPLQSLKDHKYYYRSGESHSSMPHEVIAGMMGKNIPPSLNLMFAYPHFSSIITDDFLEFDVRIRNVSQVMAEDIWINYAHNESFISISSGHVSLHGSLVDSQKSVMTDPTFKMPPGSYYCFLKIRMNKRIIRDIVHKTRTYHLFNINFGCKGSLVKEYNFEFSGKELLCMINHNPTIASALDAKINGV